ncbi:hypothetical protein CALVIDRAFT_265346 [Calocera viscosa TUFC12733]|uniref:Uncharacterized protein n=1 Tax=Calocera viscosa (strain TUFC12733) TaxID=1330018 RepID=A0A167J5Q8_CALVF|nr:hypothetical protein CALVIDRAFT_265346 [Calocera viscosa TUFC12733]
MGGGRAVPLARGQFRFRNFAVGRSPAIRRRTAFWKGNPRPSQPAQSVTMSRRGRHWRRQWSTQLQAVQQPPCSPCDDSMLVPEPGTGDVERRNGLGGGGCHMLGMRIVCVAPT